MLSRSAHLSSIFSRSPSGEDLLNLCLGHEVPGCLSPLRRGRRMRLYGRTPPASTMDFSLSSDRCVWAQASSSGTERPQNAVHWKLGQKMLTEKRWRDFFSDPSQWWDHRSEKENPKYPDFRNKKTGEGLWLKGKLNPPWVETELSRTAPGTLQEHIYTWNKRLAKYVKAGQYEKALEVFDRIQREGLHPDKFSFIAVVKACGRLRSLKEGKHIHKQIIKSGCGWDLYLCSGLVNMYAKCGSIEDAMTVFENMPTRDLVSWNAMILGHAKCGQGQKALKLSREMQDEGVEPDSVTFVGMINACASISALEEGRLVHEQIIQRGLDSGIFVGSSLINMYATCGSIDDAYRVFESMPVRDVVCWNAMIQGYVNSAREQKALDLSRKMQQEGLEPNSATFVGLLNACANLGALEEGRHFHEEASQRGLESGIFVGSSLIHMYTECGQMKDAWKVFNSMPVRDVVCWNIIIEGCMKFRRPQNALDIYRIMHRESVRPDINTFVGVINTCARLAALEEGRGIHKQIIQRRLETTAVVGVSLIHMYASCGRMEDARTVFRDLPIDDVTCWNAMIQGYVKCGQGQKALEIYLKMQLESVTPDTDTFVGVLDACASVGALEEGMGVHAQIRETGCETDVLVSDSLARMYVNCRIIKDKQKMYNQVTSREVLFSGDMLRGLAMHVRAKEALKISGRTGGA